MLRCTTAGIAPTSALTVGSIVNTMTDGRLRDVATSLFKDLLRE
jgi:hypothetical protein